MPSNHPLTTGQAAAYCHVSQGTIVNWIKEGKLNGYTTPGGHYRIPQSDLVSFLKAHGMPIAAALTRSAQPGLLLLSNNPTIQDLVETAASKSGFQVSLVDNDYAVSAEAGRSQPDVVIIDIRASSNPLGLCQWLRETTEDITLLVVGDGHKEVTEQAAKTDVYLPHVDSVDPDTLPTLEAKLERLLQ